MVLPRSTSRNCTTKEKHVQSSFRQLDRLLIPPAKACPFTLLKLHRKCHRHHPFRFLVLPPRHPFLLSPDLVARDITEEALGFASPPPSLANPAAGARAPLSRTSPGPPPSLLPIWELAPLPPLGPSVAVICSSEAEGIRPSPATPAVRARAPPQPDLPQSFSKPPSDLGSRFPASSRTQRCRHLQQRCRRIRPSPATPAAGARVPLSLKHAPLQLLPLPRLLVLPPLLPRASSRCQFRCGIESPSKFFLKCAADQVQHGHRLNNYLTWMVAFKIHMASRSFRKGPPADIKDLMIMNGETNVYLLSNTVLLNPKREKASETIKPLFLVCNEVK